MPPPMTRRMRFASKVMGPPGIDDRDLALLEIGIPRCDGHAVRFRDSSNLDIELADGDPSLPLARDDRAISPCGCLVEQEDTSREHFGEHALGRAANAVLPPPVGQDFDSAMISATLSTVVYIRSGACSRSQA